MKKNDVSPNWDAFTGLFAIGFGVIYGYDRRRILYTCILSVGYALIFEHLGYVISTFLFMVVMMTITSGKDMWKKSVVISLLFSVGVYFIFNTLLSISLPPLPFGE